MPTFSTSAVCMNFSYNLSQFVHFRERIGKEGIELILAESIRVNDDKSDGEHHGTAFIDSTVQEKNVTYHTDAKLHKKIVGKVLKIVKELNLPTRQSHIFVLKEIYWDQCFPNHPKSREKAIKTDKRLRTITGRLIREFKCNLEDAINVMLAVAAYSFKRAVRVL